MLLYFVKSKMALNARILLFLGQYIHSFVLPKISGVTPLNPPLL